MADNCKHGTVGWCGLCAHLIHGDNVAMNNPKVRDKIAALESRVRELEAERDKLREDANGLLLAAEALICAINENIGMRDAPLKYTVPWDKATALYRAAEKFKKSAALKG